MDLSAKEKALLNKVYRAVHDLVCPNCGGEMHRFRGTSKINCTTCVFEVTDAEMDRMRNIVAEWGQEAVQFFLSWRR